jgi:valyl-tRNA synthetase
MKLSKAYDPSEHEAQMYKLWEQYKVFTPKHRGSDATYSIVMPPPNANANLHIGYELTAALEDIPARYHRMKGEATLLLPGADHAGFETQVVYEKQLAKEGKSRFNFTREQLYDKIWDFVAGNRENFLTQMRRMGVSADWDRFTFTLDEKIITRAYGTFKKMWDEGLIYRGERLVNFCTFHGTAFADIEVAYKEEKGHLWHLRYPLTDGSGEVEVATTRPETMFGDTAVAVHPDDSRYKKFIGKTVKLPLTNREIPIIADAMVELEFGTGAVKITPAHDQNDYEVSERHDLPKITVIDHEGKLNSEAPAEYRELTVEEARKKVVTDLKEQGFLVRVEDHTHNVGHCYKCDTVIQPLLREQWFINMQPLATKAIAALKADEITFYPETKKEQLIRYLEGLRDWNISRQIAWGIPIPAFQNIDDPDDWMYDERVKEETITGDGKTYKRDPDVFDTWFSSSSWPYAPLEHPDSKDLKDFYPLSLMETGGEILYPWVSRMVMLGLYVTGKVPFKAVYIHGYVMAEDGAKMSKSIGNVVDPLPVIDQYGSDALRMGIIAGRTPAVNRGYDTSKVEGARNFANKLWNVARYTQEKLERQEITTPTPTSDADNWVLSKLQQYNREISDALDTYRFAEAYESLYKLVWDEVADWYIEASKSSLNPSLLLHVLESILKLTHPFAPFVTEAIWQALSEGKGGALAVASWPTPESFDAAAAKRFEAVKAIVTETRLIKTSLGTNSLHLFYHPNPLLADNAELIRRLSGASEVTETKEGEGITLTSSPTTAWLVAPTEALVHFHDELAKKIHDQTAVIARLTARLDNKSYISSAPAHVVKQTEEQLAEAEATLATLKETATRFKN